MHSSRSVKVTYKISCAEDLEELLLRVIEDASDESLDCDTQIEAVPMRGGYVVSFIHESDTDDVELEDESEEEEEEI